MMTFNKFWSSYTVRVILHKSQLSDSQLQSMITTEAQLKKLYTCACLKSYANYTSAVSAHSQQLDITMQRMQPVLITRINWS
jgi:hypothetical protein